jgi:GNAT superfamily N-acetyltransferase
MSKNPSDEVSGDTVRVIRLSQAASEDRQSLLDAYAREVYVPAFPDETLREDPGNWLHLLSPDPPLGPPQPLLEVTLLIDTDERVVGGVTTEFYRTAGVGLLTYIAVREGSRRRGLGQQLVKAAQSWIDETAGADVLMLAETERGEDAQNETEMSETMLRQERLARLGARMVDLDYVMPPLREGLATRRLHLMVFRETACVSARTVLAVLDELAHALGTDLAKFDDTRAMVASLARADLLAVESLPLAPAEGRRCFIEAPVFSDLDATAFTFVFELHYDLGATQGDSAQPGTPADRPRTSARGSGSSTRSTTPINPVDGVPRAAFRLRELSRRLAADTRDRSYSELIQPVRSFLDDVTMGPAGTNGRPLIFAASGAPPEDPSRRVCVVRPAKWEYEYENEITCLTVSANRRVHEFRLRDSFCAFESGRLLYLLTLTQHVMTAPADAERIDEYVVLQFQQLILDETHAAGAKAALRFSSPAHTDAPDSECVSLIDFAEARLKQFESERDDGTDRQVADGVRDVIERSLVPAEYRRRRIASADLLRLCVGVESAAMLDTAVRVRQSFASDRRATADKSGAPDERAIATSELHRFWLRTNHASPDMRPHEKPEIEVDRSFLALAGVAQAVPDFPWQDLSEVYDSTVPAAQSIDSSLFVHPRFVLEVAKNWRSFEGGRPCIGTCPYLLLMFVVALHDELVVTEMEDWLDQMVYGEPATSDSVTELRADGQTSADSPIRATPMNALLAVLDNSRKRADANLEILESNLRRRFELFRWVSIQRSGNIFRYPKERDALEAIQTAMGIDARFTRAHETVDRMETLVEDLASLTSSYAEQKTNKVLWCIALLSVLSVSTDVGNLFSDRWHRWGFLSALIVALAGLGLAYWWSLRKSGSVLGLVYWWNLRKARRKGTGGR